MNFPQSPTNGQQYTLGDRSWKFNGAVGGGVWDLLPISSTDVDTAASAAQTALALLPKFSSTPPLNPAAGQVWVADDMREYKWHVSTTGGQWIETGGLASIGSTLLQQVIGGFAYDDGTLLDVLDQSKPLANYTALRSYSGRAKTIRITTAYIAGFFYLDLSDTTTIDNGGVCIVDASNRRWKRIVDGALNVRWWGAKGDGANNDAPAIQSAINFAGNLGADLYAPRGKYRLEAQLTMRSGVRLSGAGAWIGFDALSEAATVFYAAHTGAAMVSFKGAIGCTLQDIGLQGDQTLKPKTGIILGRDSTASAGQHIVRRVSICGWYTQTPLYLVASENNFIEDLYCWNFGGDALYGPIFTTHDFLAVDNLVTSTCLDNVCVRLNNINTSPSSSAAGIFIHGSESMGTVTFIATYLIQYAGTYVRWKQGSLDGKGMLGPVTFMGLGTERFSGGDPQYGFDLVAEGNQKFNGFSATGVRFDFMAGANHAQIKQDPTVFLEAPNVVIQPPEAFPYAENILQRQQIHGGIFSVGRDHEWKPLPLASGVLNQYGAGYVQAAYRINALNQLELRGDIVASGLGVLATLPANVRTAESQIRYAGSNKLLYNTQGQLILLAGSPAEIELSVTPIGLSAS